MVVPGVATASNTKTRQEKREDKATDCVVAVFLPKSLATSCGFFVVHNKETTFLAPKYIGTFFLGDGKSVPVTGRHEADLGSRETLLVFVVVFLGLYFEQVVARERERGTF